MLYPGTKVRLDILTRCYGNPEKLVNFNQKWLFRAPLRKILSYKDKICTIIRSNSSTFQIVTAVFLYFQPFSRYWTLKFGCLVA